MGRLYKRKFDYIHFILNVINNRYGDKGAIYSELGNMRILTFTTIHWVQHQYHVELLGRFILPSRHYFNYNHLQRG